MKITIVGYGNMGKTFASSFISSRYIKPEDILVCTRTIPNKKDRFGIPSENFITAPNESIQETDIVLLSVKPQDFNTVGASLKPHLNPEQILFSVMAGVRIEYIQSVLQIPKVVRSMPNLGTQIGIGMSVFSASNETNRKDLFILQNLINTTGKSLYVEDESLLNPATAVSGSGPAYVFYIMNAMMQSAEKLGFSYSEAELLVRQTFLGAIHLQSALGLSNEALISKVASKGGTTEQALQVFQQNNLEQLLHEAIMAANDKAIALGDIF